MTWEIRFTVKHDYLAYPERLEDIYQMIRNELRHVVDQILKIEMIPEENRDS